MEGYSVKIIKAPDTLTARDKIRIKDITNAIYLDDVTQQSESPLIIDYDYHVILEVHNEKSDNKDYTKIVVVDKSGNKYVTGSESFRTSLEEIVDEMTDCGESDYQIEVYRKDSKNYKGKQFITCSIV